MPLRELEPNEHGRITVKPLDKNWQAVCLFRPGSGKPVRRKASARTKTEAQRLLIAKLKNERDFQIGALNSDMRFKDVAALWMTNYVEMELADSSADVYRQRLEKVTLPVFGNYRLREITGAMVNEFLNVYLPRNGHKFHARRSIRSTLRGPLQYAVDNGGLKENPAVNVKKMKRMGNEPRPRVTALTELDKQALFDALDADRYAVKSGLNEIVRFMLMTGCRIGETLGVTWGDFEADFSVLNIARNTVTVKAKGIVSHEGKTESSVRPISVPATLAIRLSAQYLERPRPLGEAVFGAVPRVGFEEKGLVWRDRSNLAKSLRRFIRRSGYAPSDPTIRVVTHLFRRTAVTQLGEHGLTMREIADHVGHRSLTTTGTYLGRTSSSSRAADALDAGRLAKPTRDFRGTPILSEVHE